MSSSTLAKKALKLRATSDRRTKRLTYVCHNADSRAPRRKANVAARVNPAAYEAEEGEFQDTSPLDTIEAGGPCRTRRLLRSNVRAAHFTADVPSKATEAAGIGCAEQMTGQKCGRMPYTRPTPVKRTSGRCGGPSSAATSPSSDGLASRQTATDSAMDGSTSKFKWVVGEVRAMDSDTKRYRHWVESKRFNFDLDLRQLAKIEYASGSETVAIRTRPVDGFRSWGNVLVLFKEKQAMFKFVDFMEKKGVGLARTTSVALENEWNQMQPE